MTAYLDVSVVRIQSYLTRAPNLQARRGASTMISNASRAARESCPDGTELNTEAGAVDGVVSMRLSPGTDWDVPATEVLISLRRALPGADLYAARWDGDTYTAARSREPAREQHWAPAVSEWPLAKTCDWCRTWPATPRDHPVDGREENYCADCSLRADAGGAARARRAHRVPGPERDLLAALPGFSVPDDFDELSELGVPADDTHVVTIYADGNAVGDYMKAQSYRPDLASEIHRATWTAVAETVRILAVDQSTLPVIPHLVGGDDVLVSLPAHLVWPGLRELLGRFENAFPTQGGRPTLSAGAVVHHRKHPLSDVVDIASTLLRTAKRSHPGQAALAWHSVTHDGATATDRAAITLADLVGSTAALRTLAELSASARQQLGRLCRDGRTGGSVEELDAHVDRLGLHNVVAPFRGGGIALEDALGMLRWGTP